MFGLVSEGFFYLRNTTVQETIPPKCNPEYLKIFNEILGEGCSEENGAFIRNAQNIHDLVRELKDMQEPLKKAENLTKVEKLNGLLRAALSVAITVGTVFAICLLLPSIGIVGLIVPLMIGLLGNAALSRYCNKRIGILSLHPTDAAIAYFSPIYAPLVALYEVFGRAPYLTWKMKSIVKNIDENTSKIGSWIQVHGEKVVTHLKKSIEEEQLRLDRLEEITVRELKAAQQFEHLENLTTSISNKKAVQDLIKFYKGFAYFTTSQSWSGSFCSSGGSNSSG